MSEKRVIRKMKKLALRITEQMETVRDVMDDLEIEFEMLQNQISKLESKKNIRNEETLKAIIVDDDDEDTIDLENTSTVTANRKF
jgi:predicted  nucleic acid-binding Zn-ribbon protein